MKKIKIVAAILLLAGCSQYQNRMVRVKSQKTNDKKEVSSQANVSRDKVIQGMGLEYFELEAIVADQKIQTDKSDSAQIDLDKQENLVYRVEKKVFSYLDKDKKQNKLYPPDEDEVKRKYHNANILSIVSLVMLILFFFAGITLIVAPFLLLSAAWVFSFSFFLPCALILSAIARSTYKYYENPGVLERRTMALGVYITSLILVGLSILILLLLLLLVFIFILLFI
jgi:hypothetical protein